MGLYFPVSNVNAAEYKVSITNLTKGQVMHHPLMIFHSKKLSIFKLGYEASPGLELLAKDGDHRVIRRELRRNERSIEKVVQARDVLKPRKTMHFNIKSRAKVFSVLSMLATTNDGFLGGNKIPLNLESGKKAIYFLGVYDAGAEANNESCRYVPGPPCDSHYRDTRNAEGIVRKHPGVHGESDLNKRKYGFNSKSAAKIVIQRVK